MNDLKNLSNEEIIQYHELLKKASKRALDRKTKTYDSKFLYHVVRLLSEVEEMLSTGDLNLQEKGRREHMKAIRRGEVSETDIRKWAADKEHQLEKVFSESKLPQEPSKSKIRKLLFQCLEEHYGSLENHITQLGWAEQSLRDIDLIINEARSKLYN